MHHQNPYAASDRKSLAMPESGRAPGPSSLYPLAMKTAPGGKQRLRFSNTCMKRRNWGTVPVDDTHAPPMTAHPRKRKRESNEPLTAGGRELRLTARPPARFSSLRSPRLVNQKQESSGNTLLAQRYPLPGNRYLWRTTARDSYLTTTSLIATRGCHNRCGFCYLSTDGLQIHYRMS